MIGSKPTPLHAKTIFWPPNFTPSAQKHFSRICDNIVGLGQPMIGNCSLTYDRNLRIAIYDMRAIRLAGGGGRFVAT